MKTKWNLLVVFVLLASLVGGTTSTAQAQETHYFTWEPAAPQEGGGSVTFTATPPEGYSNLEWSRSTDPGGATCDLPMGSVGDGFVSTELLKSGVYQVCLKITYVDSTTYDDIQPVTVTNLPPALGTATTTPGTTVAGFPVTASVPITDYDSGLTCTVNFGDGTGPVDGILNGSCTAMHTYAVAGPYTVTFTVTELGVNPVTATTSHTVVPPYANIVFASEGTVQNPEAALDAPDSLYASIRASSTIALDLGAPVSGAKLSIYHSTRSPSCAVLIASSDGAMSMPIGSTTVGADRTLLTIPALASGFQYIGLQCGALSKKAVFQLDAIQVEPASVPDGYAIWAIGSEGDVQNSGAAVGAPDGNYATIGETGGTIMLDMGELLQGIVTIYYSADSPACPILWAGQYPLASTLPGATTTSVIIPPAGTPSFLSIQCTGADKAVFELDAVQMRSTIEPTGYGMAVFGYDLVSAAAATGEPDGQYAAMGVTSSSSAILLDMGDVVQGAILTIYHSSTSPSCQVAITSDLEQGEPQPFAMTMAGGESSIFGISQDFRYVYIVCEFGGVSWDIFELDAVHIGTAAELTGYALAASVLNGTVQNPGAAVGAPDKNYATIADGVIQLDLGAPIHGLLTIYHSSRSLACMVGAGPTSDPAQAVFIASTRSGPESTSVFMSEDNQYIWIGCSPSAGEILELDATYVDQGVIPNGYALSATGSSDAQNLDAAVGAPDSQYATITASDATMLLDMGAVQQGMLTIHHSPESPSCLVWGSVTAGIDGSVMLGWTQVGMSSSAISIPAAGVRFIWIRCETLPEGAVFELDAIHADPNAAPTGYALTAAGSDNTLNLDAAVGVPDARYATILPGGAAVILDMGAVQQGMLTVYHSPSSSACLVQGSLTFGGQSPVSLGSTQQGTPRSSLPIPEAGIRYVWIYCSLVVGEVFELDAVHAGPAPEPTGYGVDVFYSTVDVQNANAATGEPDGAYATITAADGGLILDMSGLMQGTLTVVHSTASPACLVYATGTTTSSEQPIAVGTTTPGMEQSTFLITTDIQYVWIMCDTLPRKAVFELDAVHVEAGTIAPTGYGMVVVTATSDVQNPTAAIGAPDHQYATITASNGAIWLDMGTLVQGTLTVYHASTSPSCQVAITTTVGAAEDIIMIGNTTAGQTVSTFTPELAYRYVAVGCTTLAKRQVFQLDAVQVIPLP